MSPYSWASESVRLTYSGMPMRMMASAVLRVLAEVADRMRSGLSDTMRSRLGSTSAPTRSTPATAGGQLL